MYIGQKTLPTSGLFDGPVAPGKFNSKEQESSRGEKIPRGSESSLGREALTR